MKIKFYIKTGFRNLMASKLRTLLAVLGIMVGTASVVALISSGQLATQQALEQFKSLGTELMTINFFPKSGLATNLPKVTAAKLQLMRASIADIRQLAPFALTSIPASFHEQVFDSINVVGVTEDLADIVNMHLKTGRFISDLDKAQYFCLIGEKFFEKLNTHSPVGQRIKLGTALFTIVGVADHWKENMFFPQDINNSVVIPIKSMPLVSPDTSINTSIIRLRPEANIDAVKESITNYFSKNIPGYQLNFRSAKEIIARMSTQQAIFSLLLGLIGGITLLVSGIGVMNIMLAAVAERRNEIGLRLALGAQPKDVQLLFLSEAAVLAMLGGGLGVLVGTAATFIIAQIAGWKFSLFLFPPLIGFSVSMLISLFFGFYPAYLASKLNPIDALRAS